MPDSSLAMRALRARILSIPIDLKALFAIVDHVDLDDSLRELAAAAIFYNLNSANLIPAKEGMLGFADDALVICCALHAVAHAAPEHAAKLADSDVETWEHLEEDIRHFRELLGTLWQPFNDAWPALGKAEWRGHKARLAVSDPDESTWLYQTVEETLVDRDFDEAVVAREVRKEPLLAKLQARLSVRKQHVP